MTNSTISRSGKNKFPGYIADQERRIKQGQERLARNQECADKARAKRKAKEEKLKNSLPPFLLVRSGWLNQWVWTLIALAAFTGFGVNHNYEKLEHPELAAGTVAFFLCLGFSWGAFVTPKIKQRLNHDISTIREATTKYMSEPDYKLDLTDSLNSDKLARILLQHISKYNPGIFDKMLKNPESVNDIDTAQDIILGYLKKHPSDAQKVLDTFDIETMPKKVQRKTKRYANNLRKFMKTSKSK
ncbi:MAG: hypothetical protein J5742_01785 [Alphaproteobacteria bacterium]|nr:hypothetical protein [Alphaproteobacteria bacterium]